MFQSCHRPWLAVQKKYPPPSIFLQSKLIPFYTDEGSVWIHEFILLVSKQLEINGFNGIVGVWIC